MEVFSSRIKELRTSRKLSQTQVCDGADISRPALVDYEQGRRQPSIEVLVKIARFFEVSPDYLLGFTDAQANENRTAVDDFGLEEDIIPIIRDIMPAKSKAVLFALIRNNSFQSALPLLAEMIIQEIVDVAMPDELKANQTELFKRKAVYMFEGAIVGLRIHPPRAVVEFIQDKLKNSDIADWRRESIAGWRQYLSGFIQNGTIPQNRVAKEVAAVKQTWPFFNDEIINTEGDDDNEQAT